MTSPLDIVPWQERPFTPYAPSRLQHDRRLDVVRQHLFKFLASSWRDPKDARESACEIVHVRSGTPVGAMTIDPEKDTAARVAQWAVDECVQFTRDCGELHAQNFHIVLDEAKFSVWVYPEGGDSSAGSQEALVDMALRHSENAASQVAEMLDLTLKHQATIIASLTADSTEAKRTIAQLLKESVEQMKLYKDLVDAKQLRDLEMMKAQKSEERKQLATDRFLHWADKAVEVAGTAMVGKLQQKLGEGSALDQMASLLEGEEETVFAELVKRAATRARARSEAAAALKNAEATAQESAGSTPPAAQNGAQTRPHPSSPPPKSGGLFDGLESSPPPHTKEGE